MRMGAIAGVDQMNLGLQVAGNQVGRAGLGVAHDKQVGVHGLEVANGVEHRFALAGAGAGHRQVDDIRGQALGRDLEGGACARGGFEEQVDHGLAAAQRNLLDLAFADRHERFGGVEDFQDRALRQPFERQQVTQAALLVERTHRAHVPLSCILSSSFSGPSNFTCWRGLSFRCAPTAVASIGSSRPSRSISTASVTEAGRP